MLLELQIRGAYLHQNGSHRDPYPWILRIA